MSSKAFRGPHKVNFRTERLGHNFYNRLAPSRYDRISNFNATYKFAPDVVVVHYSFFQKLRFVFKYILSCIFPKK